MKRWLTGKWGQAGGKVRRFYIVHFRKSYLASQTVVRQGECNKCGNCCEILFKCPFLVKAPEGEGEEGATWCSIYDNRPGQCAAFPVDERCLADVDFDCTFTFPPVDPETGLPSELLQIDD